MTGVFGFNLLPEDGWGDLSQRVVGPLFVVLDHPLPGHLPDLIEILKEIGDPGALCTTLSGANPPSRRLGVHPFQLGVLGLTVRSEI